MNVLNSNRIRLVVVGLIAASVIGGGSVKADFTFGKPTPLDATINSGGHPFFDCISNDGLELYIEKPIGGGPMSRDYDLFVSTRATIVDPWPAPIRMGPPINTGVNESFACLSSDDLELYFTSDRPGGSGSWDLWISTRPTRFDPWGPPENLGTTINTSGYDYAPWITPDGLELYFSSDRSGGYGNDDIWVTKRVTVEDNWGTPVNLGPVVNSAAFDGDPCLSPDGLVLFFSDTSDLVRPGGLGRTDLWMARRKSITDPWEPPVNLGPGLSTSTWDYQPRLSPDGNFLYFTSLRTNGRPSPGFNIWKASIDPIIDLNNDLKVDLEDMHITVDHWGQNNSLCDIGPTPFGDGIVDVEDLKVLAGYLFDDYRALAQWKLDEKEGDIASDSVGGHDGILHGEPVWKSTGGRLCGALQFDGIDDYIETDFVLDPADGAFSVFAWINGGAPGQIIISQKDGDGTGETWLGTDSLGGNLMTGLVPKKIGWITPQPLVSESVITDNQWHHVGFVWDGSYRILNVDGIEVAKDTAAQNPPKSANGGLYIGASKDLDAGTFFSGLIDDVRIYNRALSADEIADLAQ